MISLRQAQDLQGKTVIDVTGDKVGKVDALYVDKERDVLTFATVSTGMLGTSSHFIPLDRAELRGDEVVVPFEKDVVKDAPSIPADGELTEQEEERLYAHYGELMTQPPGGKAATDDLTLSEERLRAGTQKVEAGRARLRKYATTETETVDVPVTKERVALEREPIRDGEQTASGDAGFGQDEREMVLTEERPVVAKEAVPVERVRLEKEAETDQVRVSDEVRKERAELDTESR